MGTANGARPYWNGIANVLARTDAWQRNGWLGRKDKLPGGVPWRAVDTVRGPQCATFTVQIRDDDLGAVLKLGDRLAMATNCPGGVTVYQAGAVVRFEFTLPPSQWREVPLSGLPRRPGKLAVGEQALGGWQWLNWDAPHKAVFGRTRTGKTVLLADLVIGIARAHRPDDYRLLILNPKNDPALQPFERLAHLEQPVAVTYPDCRNQLLHALGEMEARRVDPVRARTRLVVVVDEVAHLVQNEPEVGPILVKLSQLAGGLNVNLVVASQSANPTVFGRSGNLAKTNLGSRFVFQLPNDQAYLATGLTGQDTERLGGKGDGLVVSNERVCRFRAALPSGADYAALPRTEVPPEPVRPVIEDPDRVDVPVPDGRALVPRPEPGWMLLNTSPWGVDQVQAYELRDFIRWLGWAIKNDVGVGKVREARGGAQDQARVLRALANEYRTMLKGA